MNANSVYVAAGRIRDGIIGKIEKEMAAKFPSHELPNFSRLLSARRHPGLFVSDGSVPFQYPFRQADGGLIFTDSRGIQTQVAGFGLWNAYLRPYKNLREQVEILYYPIETRAPSRN